MLGSESLRHHATAKKRQSSHGTDYCTPFQLKRVSCLWNGRPNHGHSSCNKALWNSRRRLAWLCGSSHVFLIRGCSCQGFPELKPHINSTQAKQPCKMILRMERQISSSRSFPSEGSLHDPPGCIERWGSKEKQSSKATAVRLPWVETPTSSCCVDVIGKIGFCP